MIICKRNTRGDDAVLILLSYSSRVTWFIVIFMGLAMEYALGGIGSLSRFFGIGTVEKQYCYEAICGVRL